MGRYFLVYAPWEQENLAQKSPSSLPFPSHWPKISILNIYFALKKKFCLKKTHQFLLFSILLPILSLSLSSFTPQCYILLLFGNVWKNSTIWPSVHVNKYRDILFLQRFLQTTLSFVQGFLKPVSSYWETPRCFVSQYLAFINNIIIHITAHIHKTHTHTSSVMKVILICCSQSEFIAELGTGSPP